MPPSVKAPSQAELSSLEHAFASDPASEAYRPLTEAYLATGRFMEAMVVCKKGVKAHPDDPSARVLLARVYADQGKDRRGLEEIQSVLTSYPTFAAALRLAGVMHLRLGEKTAGEAALRKAYEISPDDPETRAALQQFNVSPAAAPPPPPAPTPVSVPPRRTTGPGMPAARPGSQPRMPAAAVATGAEAPTPTPPPGSRARNVAIADALAEQYKTKEFTIVAGIKKPKNRRGTLATTAALAVVLAIALGGWFFWSKARKERFEAIDRLIKETVPLLEKDTAAAYAEAAKKAAEILEKDGESVAGRAFLAYADSLRALEHGDAEAAKAGAAQVSAALAAKQRHSHLIAAEAYLKASAGDLAGAQEAVKAVIEGEGASSPLLQGALGAVLLRSGDLDAARDELVAAQKSAPGDARLSFLLAEQFRRRGEGYDLQASGFYDYTLRIEKDHAGAILGKGLVLLARGQLDEAGRSAEAVFAPTMLASRPQLALAQALKAGVFAAQGKAAEAAAAEAEAARLDPANAEIPRLQGVRKLREGDAKGAAEAFQRAISMEPKRIQLVADLVQAQLALANGPKLAIDTVKRAISRAGESARLVLLLGQAYQASGDADLAQGQYQKAIQLGGKFPDARVALARLYRAKGNVPGALVELTQAIDEYGQGGAGGAAAAFVEMAEAERARGAKPAVLQGLFEKALGMDPASCDALWGAGKLELDTNKLTDAAKQRLEGFVKLCGKGARTDEATRLLGGR